MNDTDVSLPPMIELIPGLMFANISNDLVVSLRADVERFRRFHAKDIKRAREGTLNRRSGDPKASGPGFWLADAAYKRQALVKAKKLLALLEEAQRNYLTDMHNNVNRFFTFLGQDDRKPRQWRVVFRVTAEGTWPRYLVRHVVETDRFAFADLNQMTNLY